MADPTTILNLALTRAGQAPVLSIDDTSSDTAKLGKRLFPDTVKEVLRSHPWNCLTQRASLTPLTTAPIFGWAYSYPLPETCMYLSRVNGHESSESYVQDYYKVESGHILTDADVCNITYVGYTDDTSRFDPLLTESIIVLLASKLASRVGRDARLSLSLLQEYMDAKLPAAMKADAREQKLRRNEYWTESSWVRSRRMRI